MHCTLEPPDDLLEPPDDLADVGVEARPRKRRKTQQFGSVGLKQTFFLIQRDDAKSHVRLLALVRFSDVKLTPDGSKCAWTIGDLRPLEAPLPLSHGAEVELHAHHYRHIVQH